MLRVVASIALFASFLVACSEKPAAVDNASTVTVDSTPAGGCFFHALNNYSTFLQLSFEN
ncbi:MAG: hypothetical protein IM534_06965, partial [Chitinophagaceae bacterium]|nr:hypothetical protein [Chitinophagaceae bacterium]